MPGKTIGKYLNRGFPGTVSRTPDTIIEAYPCGDENIQFGAPVVLDSDGMVIPFGVGHTDDDFVGIAVRVAKQEHSQEEATCYREGDAVDVLTRGNISVTIEEGNPAARRPVYLDDEGNILADNGGGSAVKLNGVVFSTSSIDAKRVGEIAVLSRRV